MPNDGENNEQYHRRAIIRGSASVASVGIISGCGAFGNNPYDGADLENVFMKVMRNGGAKFAAIFDTTVPPEPETQQTAFKTGAPDQLIDWQNVSFDITTLEQTNGSIERTKYNPVERSKFPIQNTITGRYTGIQNNIPSWSGDHSWYRLPVIEFINAVGRHTDPSSTFSAENTTFIIEYPSGIQQSFPLQYLNAEIMNNSVIVDTPNSSQNFDSGEIFSAYNSSGIGLPFRSGSEPPSSPTVMVGSTYNDNVHLSRVVSSSEFKFAGHSEVYRRLNFDIQLNEAVVATDAIFAETFQELTVSALLSTVSAGVPPSGGAAIRGSDLFAQTTYLFELLY